MGSQSEFDRKLEADDVVETTQRYRIVRLFARSGFGSVYVARDESLGREVQLSIGPRLADHASLASRFLLGGWINGNLEHPGISAVYSLGETGCSLPFYVMPFVRGDYLQDLIDRYHKHDQAKRDRAERRLALGRLLRHFIDVCHAIAFAHDRGAIHCDIKPFSVTVTKFGETVVGNWDLARFVDGSLLDTNRVGMELRSRSGSMRYTKDLECTVGTPAYMSPEQATGRQGLMGPASDVFSLGATLYEILTGNPPYRGERAVEVISCAQRCEYLRPTKINRTIAPALEAICLKAMARRPEDRYTSPMALAEDIERWSADAPVLAYREPFLAQLARRARLRWRRF